MRHVLLLVCAVWMYQFTNAHPKRSSTFRSDYTFGEDTKAFYKLHITGEDWHAARKICTSEGATFFYPRNHTEVDLVVHMMEDKGVDNVFVGITDLLSEGDFETYDGRALELVYNVWAPGESNEHNCVVLRRNTKFLCTEDCSKKLPFLCRMIPK